MTPKSPSQVRRPVSNRSGMNGPDGPCDDVFECACIGVVRDPDSGVPTHLLIEGPNGGPPVACPLIKDVPGSTLFVDPDDLPDGFSFSDPENPTEEEFEQLLLLLTQDSTSGTLVVFGDEPNQWIWYVDGDGQLQLLKCPPFPAQEIDPVNPPDGVAFADPDNPTPDELAAAAAALLAGAPAGSKAKFGDEPCQWIYEVDSNGDLCLLAKPWVLRTAEMYMGNTGVDLRGTDAHGTEYPIGCMSFDLPCAQEVVFEGYGHFRTDGDDIYGGTSQSYTLIDIDGTGPVSMGHVTIHERDFAGERQVPYLYKVFLDGGTHTVCFTEKNSYGSNPPDSPHKVDYNQFKMIAKWIE